MGIPVKLPVFEGPLDLLLHLIEKNKVNIYDIPIVEITDQYMEYISPDGEGRSEYHERVHGHGGNPHFYQMQDASPKRSQ